MALDGVDKHTNSKNTAYCIPEETQNVFQNGILNNPLITPTLPKDITECAKTIRFEGTSRPSIPINWRFAESISALKGLEAAIVNALLKRKYGLEPQEAVINTDHAQLFIMSILLNTIDPEGEAVTATSAAYSKYFKDCDLHGAANSVYRAAATNIYRCKDGQYFHLHGSMNPEPTTLEEAWALYGEKVSQIDSSEMQRLASDVYKQAGTICWTIDEFKQSEHGKANAHVGLYDIHSPAGGLKVVDLTRIIAAPALTRGLAELGASVMRVTTEHIPDMSSLHLDLSWGKWSSHLDFRKEEDRSKLRELVREADVVVQGYRPDVLNKYGFGMDDLIELTKNRERGLIVVRENCYGWNGPWSYRSGWQQISDACCGVSVEFGRAMGNDEPVTPVFPNSDFCTGTSGVIAVLNAILQRGSEGGSYKVDAALNYYSQWLVNSVGVYPEEVWQDVWARNGRQVFRHHHNMGYTIPRFFQMIKTNSNDVLFKPEFFEIRHSGAIGKDVKGIKPIVQYPDGKVKLMFNIGTRGNGIDQPRWPKDLTTEVVA
ncbi:CoA-transferase family III domain-containing protein [Phaeosphaeriaceae sp. PMI808]|nr:CoA-transferase family III domain-containing protein [Phaeosphaeriaceae sp. PMI808]